MTNPFSSLPGRRWQFSVRGLLVVLTLASLWLGWQASAARRQRRMVERVLHLGGHVEYDYRITRDRRGRTIGVPNARPGAPAWLVWVFGIDAFQNVVFVDLGETQATDDDLALIGLVPSVESVVLTSTPITSDGLRHLRGLSRLRVLSLWKTAIDDRGLAHLAGHTGLENLVLDNTGIGDAGLVHLRDLTELEEWLGLCHTKVTDAGLPNLARLRKLRSLNLIGTQATKAGMRELQKSLPNTDISPY